MLQQGSRMLRIGSRTVQVSLKALRCLSVAVEAPGYDVLPTLHEVRSYKGSQCLEVTWSDGAKGRFHYLWLRDNCSSYFDSSTGQRISPTLSLGPESPSLVEVRSDGPVGEDLRVRWEDGHQSCFPSFWLREHCFETRHQKRVEPRLWGSDLAAHFLKTTLPAHDLEAVNNSTDHLKDWLTSLRDYGVALLTGAPRAQGKILEIASLISYARKTHYGETFQVRSEPHPKHLAYTPVQLEVHSDLNYRETSPGIQLLHCLASEAEGGESTFVDGFKAAETLRQESPERFQVLTEVSIPFRMKDGSGYHYHKVPCICVDDQGGLVEVHYNERTRGPLELPWWLVPKVHKALAHFREIIHRPESVVEVKLRAGEVLAFNNRRILHGRKAFDPRTGLRHLEGCYVDYDEFLTCLRKHGVTPPAVFVKAPAIPGSAPGDRL